MSGRIYNVPAAVGGGQGAAAQSLSRRLSCARKQDQDFVALPIDRLDRLVIKREVDEIGRPRIIPK
jgi:hypothetical protein